MTQLMKLPNGEYYVGKTLDPKGLGTFIYSTKFDRDNHSTGNVILGNVRIPKELVGKKLMFKVEVVEK